MTEPRTTGPAAPGPAVTTPPVPNSAVTTPPVPNSAVTTPPVTNWAGLRWVVLTAAAALGLLGFSIASAAGLRAGLGFVGGMALAVGSFEFGAFNIRFTGRHAPELTLLVAMLSYLTTAVALALVLAAASPRVVDGPAVATGLFAGLVVWLGAELGASRVVQEHP